MKEVPGKKKHLRLVFTLSLKKNNFQKGLIFFKSNLEGLCFIALYSLLVEQNKVP